MVLRIKVFDFSGVDLQSRFLILVVGSQNQCFFDCSGGQSKIRVWDFNGVNLKSGFLNFSWGFLDSRLLNVVGVNLLNLGI